MNADKVIFKYPKGVNFTAMWGQFSGMADCCGAGVIGRLSGITTTAPSLCVTDAPTITKEYKAFTTMKDYIVTLLPSNKLFAGPAEWLHWAIVEDLVRKKESGVHTPQLKAASVDKNKFDFESNTYHKFWAGPSYKVQMWFITDRYGKYMGHHEDICCNAFMEFVHRHQLGDVWKSGKIPGSYGSQQLWGAVYHPAYSRIKERLAIEIPKINKELNERWKKVAPHVVGTKPIKDKVAKSW